ncbi:MAG: hypothetical protein WCO21_00325 [bacterium]|nr:phosphatase PAP2 family protein [Candidatus Jorgensenbacteria bacterium]
MIQYEAVCNLGGVLREAVSLKTFVDDWIPFNIYIIYPYILCLFYLPILGIFYAFNRRISTIQLVSFYFSAIFIYFVTYAIYLVFPTTANGVMITSFNPVIMNDGMFRVLQNLYGSSTPLGDFPSLHVIPMVFISLFLYKHWRSLFWMFLPFAVFGVSGTVLLKFHTFIGLLGGVAMGYFGYYILYEKLIFKYFSKFLPATE